MISWVWDFCCLIEMDWFEFYDSGSLGEERKVGGLL